MTIYARGPRRRTEPPRQPLARAALALLPSPTRTRGQPRRRMAARTLGSRADPGHGEPSVRGDDRQTAQTASHPPLRRRFRGQHVVQAAGACRRRNSRSRERLTGPGELRTWIRSRSGWHAARLSAGRTFHNVRFTSTPAGRNAQTAGHSRRLGEQVKATRQCHSRSVPVPKECCPDRSLWNGRGVKAAEAIRTSVTDSPAYRSRTAAPAERAHRSSPRLSRWRAIPP
jgi:hypothetical protein